MLLQMTLFHYFYIFHCTYVCVCVCVCAVSFLSIILISCLPFSHSVVPNFCNPWTIAHQVPVSMRFSRQE